MTSGTLNNNDDPPELSTNLPSMREIRVVTKEPQLPIDVLLLTVEKCEFLACYKVLKNPYRCYFDGLGYVYFEDVNDSQEEKVKVALLRCYKGGIGPGASLISIKNAVAKLTPKAVISVGTCSGLKPEKTKLGDVIVSAKLTTYASKVVTSRGEQSTGVRSCVSKRFLELIKNCADGWQAPLKNPEAREVEVHCGEFLSGPEQVTTEWRRKQLAELHPQAVAMEMEGEGIFTAAFDSEIQWVIVKGIADYADSTPLTVEGWLSCASVMAASLVAHILSDPSVFCSWPHYEDASTQSSAGKSKRKSSFPCTHDPKHMKHGAPAPAPFDLQRCQARLHTIYNTVSQVRTTPWNRNDTVHIDEVYTNLSWLKDHRTPRGTHKVKLKDICEVLKDNKPDKRSRLRFPKPKPKRILVYGRPGIGKSTFSQKIAFDWAAGREEVLNKFNVLLMVKLRDVCGLKDFGAILKASKLLAADDTISADDLYDYIRQNQEEVMLVLDGYDEYHAGVASPVDQIWERNILGDCYVIMTTRPREADKVRKSSDIQLQIRGFDSEEQVKQFAGRYLAGPEEVETLVTYLSKEEIWDLAEIPLLLLMMCLVWRDRHDRGLPKSKLELYEKFVETLLYQMATKESPDKPVERKILESYQEDLSKIGKLALDALLQGTLYFPLKQLHTPSSALSETMIRAGLFQISKLSSAVPDESVFFLHKSIQEFLVAWFIMHEAGLQDGRTDCLSSITSLDRVSKVWEILIFMCQWSEKGAKAVFSLLQLLGEKEGVTKYNFTEVPAIEDMSLTQRKFCTMCLDLFRFCSVVHRCAVYSSFLDCVHGVVVVKEDQRSSLASKHILKSLKPYLLFFTANNDMECADDDVFSIMRDLETVVVTCYGDKKSLNNCPDLLLNHFFLNKEGQQIVLYLNRIRKFPAQSVEMVDGFTHMPKRESPDGQNVRPYYGPHVEISCVRKVPALPGKLLSEITSTPEYSHQKPANHVTQNQDFSSFLHLTEKTFGRTLKHSLSLVRTIIQRDLTKEELTVVNNVLPFINRPRFVEFKWFKESCDVQQIESLVSGISFTDNLVSLKLWDIGLTAKCFADIARSLHQAPNLYELKLSQNTLSSELWSCSFHLGDQECQLLATSLKHVVRLKVLDLSRSPLGPGITELGKQLHHVRHLTHLNLRQTHMSEEGVTDVAHALKHLSELKELDLSYNSLCRGVSKLIQHLRGVRCLRVLRLCGVQMTKKEVSELVTAAYGRVMTLRTDYHDFRGHLRTEPELSRMGVRFDHDFLAGEGAFHWALEHGFNEYNKEDLITDRCLQTWQKCRAKLQSSPSALDSHKPYQLENLCNFSNESENLDTVGAVCMDTSGQLCAGASSGGVLYKTPGRIGQAAVYGSGCWATRHDFNQVGVACCTSGCGEQLIKTLLAKECTNLALSRDAVGAVQEGLGHKFLGSSLLSSEKQKLGGVLLLRVEGGEGSDDCTVDLVWGHTTDSMCIGYMAEQDKKPRVRLSRLQSGQQLPLLVEGTVYRLPHR